MASLFKATSRVRHMQRKFPKTKQKNSFIWLLRRAGFKIFCRQHWYHFEWVAFEYIIFFFPSIPTMEFRYERQLCWRLKWIIIHTGKANSRFVSHFFVVVICWLHRVMNRMNHLTFSCSDASMKRKNKFSKNCRKWSGIWFCGQEQEKRQ